MIKMITTTTIIMIMMMMKVQTYYNRSTNMNYFI